MYKYEMHAHSFPCSGGGVEIEKHIEHLHKKGFSGMVITNHFYRGDTTVDRSLPWHDFIKFYREDFERGKGYARSYDFDLLFGIEEGVGNGKEILVYGITPDFLLKHPELKYADLAEYARLVHLDGGLLYQAHPYRDRAYIAKPGPLEQLGLLDGIEVYNAANTAEDNEKAEKLAKEKKIKCIAGSDAHSSGSAGRAGIDSETRIRTNEDIVKVLKDGTYKIIR